jgi:proteasome lid subunit RPN8/RPN11
MAILTQVLISKETFDFISRWAEKAYPHEGCGLLIGRFSGNKKEVVRLASLTNLNKNMGTKMERSTDARFSTLPDDRKVSGGNREFVMDPNEFNQETLKAEKEGLDIVGIIHTHPDHPPRPSQIDSSQPFLAQWSNIIVAVEKGHTKEMKSWFREWDNQPFVEESIEVVA